MAVSTPTRRSARLAANDDTRCSSRSHAAPGRDGLDLTPPKRPRESTMEEGDSDDDVAVSNLFPAASAKVAKVAQLPSVSRTLADQAANASAQSRADSVEMSPSAQSEQFSLRPARIENTPPTPQSLVPEASTPQLLVGRNAERQKLDGFLERCLVGRGGMAAGSAANRDAGSQQQQEIKSLYVSGGPGTGKTCSVRAAVMELVRRQPEVKHVEVNCLMLSKPTLASVLGRIAELCGGAGAARALRGRTGRSLALAARGQIAKLNAPVVLVLDEVDQLVQKSSRGTDVECPLETLFSLPLLPGMHQLAVVAVANAVDLLQRTSVPVARHLAEFLLFEPYTATELRAIFDAHLCGYEHRSSVEQALGNKGIELRARQVAKQSGDCRRLLSYFSQAIIDDDMDRAVPAAEFDRGDIRFYNVQKSIVPPKAQNDPVDNIAQLPMEQQVLLGALVGARSEAARLGEVCTRYKEMCRRLHQPLDLAQKDFLVMALQSLADRGLLELRAVGRARKAQGSSDQVVELAVSRKALREALSKANPMLGQCLHE